MFALSTQSICIFTPQVLFCLVTLCSVLFSLFSSSNTKELSSSHSFLVMLMGQQTQSSYSLHSLSLLPQAFSLILILSALWSLANHSVCCIAISSQLMTLHRGKVSTAHFFLLLRSTSVCDRSTVKYYSPLNSSIILQSRKKVHRINISTQTCRHH